MLVKVCPWCRKPCCLKDISKFELTTIKRAVTDASKLAETDHKLLELWHIRWDDEPVAIDPRRLLGI